ncbi:thiolase family protein [Novosphingobium rosa]|uniref:thiolase family protein n=1 Tax=Novosphingobium rosa TaxID=76978 RepID=UPI0008306B3F|nr:thiolase family protein [Novosphingobium rosa]
MRDVFIVGAGIHAFGRTPALTGLQQGVFAVRQALDHCGLTWPQIQFAFGGSDSAGNADTMVSALGQTGLPFVNVANGCATGGSALFGAYNAIRAGSFDLGLAVGFDKHPRGSFSPLPADWGLPDWYGETGLMLTTQFFAMKIQRYRVAFGIAEDTLGAVAEKAFANGALAEHAWRREPVDRQTILTSQMVSDPLTKFMFCSPAEGAVALVLASERKARELGLPAVRLRAVAMRTRPPGSFEVFSPALDLERGGSPTTLASQAAYEMAGVGPRDIDVAQLQDTEVGAEIMHMAENGFCADGEQTAWIAEGRTRIDGMLPVNTDGGCLACGEPIGASGLRQVYENYRQLTGRAGARQVPGEPRLGYSHVYGAPGVSAVAIVER